MATDHGFTPTIRQILKDDFQELSDEVFRASLLIQYLNLKTKSARRGSSHTTILCRGSSQTTLSSWRKWKSG